MSQISNLFLSIGKPVKDEYGRAVGKIVSFALTPSGKFDAAFIELSDGKFSKQPIENLTFNGAEITFISKIKSQASIFCDQIPFIWRKDQALKDLAEKKKISPDLYQELHNNFDSILTQLKKDAQVLSDEVAQEVARCNQDIKALSYAVLHLELEHEIGKISDETYQSAFKLLQENLKRASTEKSDMELTKTKLSNILLGDSKEFAQKTKLVAAPINEAPELPEPPVVVYVKEVGKAGI
ncbi:MAG TPA: CdvA-like protein [Candidatus Bathyarchaeia archaeon]|nr:CdvA-like protein [Candidatus Bathyarchaeia archaeon]